MVDFTVFLSVLSYFVSYRAVFQAELTCRTQDTSELHPRAFLCLVFCLGLEKSPNAKFKWTVNVFQEFFVHRRLWCTYLTLLCTIHGYSMHRVRLDCSTSTGNWFGPNFVLFFSNENTFLTQLSSPKIYRKVNFPEENDCYCFVLGTSASHINLAGSNVTLYCSAADNQETGDCRITTGELERVWPPLNYFLTALQSWSVLAERWLFQTRATLPPRDTG